MKEDVSISSVLSYISELKKNSLLPRNWVNLIAKRNEVSPTTVRGWATGRKNLPDGAILVMEQMHELLEERRNKIQAFTKLRNYQDKS